MNHEWSWLNISKEGCILNTTITYMCVV